MLGEEYSNVYIQDRSIVTSIVKAVKAAVKKINFNKLLSGYIKKYPKLKSIATSLSKITEMDESIDSFIYSTVSKLIPNATTKEKKVISNLIRFALPI